MSPDVTLAADIHPLQGTFDDLGTPLADVTFVVVDLETTGGSPAAAAITEVGAVKVRGGVVLGEFGTLVNPRMPIPPFIRVLTGITDAMVAAAPGTDTVIPSFLEFARGSVLVAHNAPFDVGFLRAACAREGFDWPAFTTVDTARLARRVLSRDEAPNCKLGTLARLFRTDTTPNHRALDDARATVDVLHGLLARLGNIGVDSLEDLTSFSGQVSTAQRRKRYLADGLPDAPGVYLFKDDAGHVLYIGKSRSLRTRVRSYFTASEMRTRMAEMVGLASEVVPVVCATALEAEVRELRLIAEHKPRYNRRSKFPNRMTWVKVTTERFPRLSKVREVRDDGATYLGPFSSTASAEAAIDALHDVIPLRQCTARLSIRRTTPACALAGMGRCGAPCEGRETEQDYDRHVNAVRQAIIGDSRVVVAALTDRIGALSTQLRYEEAALHRDRLHALVRAAARGQRLATLAGCAQLVAARGVAAGGWEIAVVRHGRLAAAGVVPPHAAPMPYIDALVATAETVLVEGAGPTASASAEEMETVLRWLDAPGTRLVHLDGEWSCVAHGAGSQRARLDAAAAAASQVNPFEDRRHLRPVHLPG